MTNHVERFHAALTVLAGHGHIKQRLIKAYEENLVDINEDELPISIKQLFADLRSQMYGVTPLNGEGPICASVRKMSFRLRRGPHARPGQAILCAQVTNGGSTTCAPT